MGTQVVAESINVENQRWNVIAGLINETFGSIDLAVLGFEMQHELHPDMRAHTSRMLIEASPIETFSAYRKAVRVVTPSLMGKLGTLVAPQVSYTVADTTYPSCGKLTIKTLVNESSFALLIAGNGKCSQLASAIADGAKRHLQARNIRYTNSLKQ
jgi:hypothetical protein